METGIMKKTAKFHEFFCFSAVIAVISALVCVPLAGCGGNESGEEQQVNMSDRYRDMVHNEFLNKVCQYDADSRYLVIVDYSLPSNSPRLFVWDAEQDEIVEQFWCAHGFGGGSTSRQPVFSNTPGSNCSSLGWYLIDRSVGVSTHWDYKYHAVDGLDDTNSNARRREILIHPWWSVSDDEAAQLSVPMNLDGRCAGCFTISDTGFDTLDRYIKSRPKRLLLWAMYEG